MGNDAYLVIEALVAPHQYKNSPRNQGDRGDGKNEAHRTPFNGVTGLCY